MKIFLVQLHKEINDDMIHKMEIVKGDNNFFTFTITLN